MINVVEQIDNFICTICGLPKPWSEIMYAKELKPGDSKTALYHVCSTCGASLSEDKWDR